MEFGIYFLAIHVLTATPNVWRIDPFSWNTGASGDEEFRLSQIGGPGNVGFHNSL